MTSPDATGVLPPELSPRRKPRRKTTVALVVLAALASSAILATSALGYAGLQYTDSQVARVSNVIQKTATTPKKVVSKAQNILIVGSDSRKGLTRKEQAALHVGSTVTAEGQRSDVMMLLHISAGGSKAEIMSFPRDSWVTIPEHKVAGKVVAAHKSKINDAYHDGGGALAVDVIQTLTGIRIDHYVEINFLGFVKMVSAVGTVQICSPRALKDKDSGLDIPKGVSTLNAETALKYARARHVDNDLGRIQRQQKLIAAIMRKATSSGVLLNPRKLANLVSAALSAVTVDSTFTDSDFLSLAKRMSSLSPSNLVFVTVPVANIGYTPPGTAVSAVQLDDAAGKVIYDKIIHDIPIDKPAPAASASASASTATVTKAPSLVRVRVLNGSGVVGKGKTAATDLQGVGFTVIGAATNAATTGATATTIRYDPSYSESLKTLKASLPGAVATAVPGLGGTFQVVVGTSYTGASKVTVSAPRASASPSATVETRTAADASCT